MSVHTTAGTLPARMSSDSAGRIADLFDTHHDRLFRLARRLTSSHDDALDLVQETFLKAARAAFIPAGATHAEAWLVRVLVNTRRDEWRRAASRRQHDGQVSLGSRPDSGQEAQTIARTVVWRALDVLHPRRRAVVVLHELEGLSASAIAALLGIATVTVRWHLSMGRRELTRALTSLTGETPR
jgi:RNA polymerase sigma factor (sigma-70 family)